jgi:hypothetical protein
VEVTALLTQVSPELPALEIGIHDTPDHIKAVSDAVFSQRVPFTYALSEEVGSLLAVCRSGGRIALTPIY